MASVGSVDSSVRRRPAPVPPENSVLRENPVPEDPAVPRYGDWQAALADAVRDPAELCRLLRLPESVASKAAAAEFPLLVPRPYLGRIRSGDPRDPLLVQVLPHAAESAAVAGFRRDPLGESEATIAPCLLRKYRGRSLIVATRACGVHCRFCFRRHSRGKTAFGNDETADVELAIERIAADESIREVILSGGDPLMLPDEQLGGIATSLSQIAHLRRFRLHTRLPMAVPDRVTSELVASLRSTRLPAIVVIHVNHPAEIDDAVAAALGRLIEAGIPVLSQTVLLHGANDRPDILAMLFERLADLRAIPYYLHQLDRVAAAAHFEVPVAEGIRIVEELRRRLPGYAVPRYVQDTPGAAHKRVLA